jgi:DNA-binding CsgD family transcriptional regulator
VLVVDDADELDWASVAVITSARARRPFPMLLSSQTAVEYDEAFADLVAAAHPGIEVALGGMELREVNRQVNQILGGTAAPEGALHIANLSGGLPGLIEAITGVGQRTGRLANVNGVWRATDELYDGRLKLTLQPFLRGLDQHETSALASLAVAGLLPRKDAEKLVGVDQVRRLIWRGLLQDGQGSVSVFPPALAELLRRVGGQSDQASIKMSSMQQWPTKTEIAVFFGRLQADRELQLPVLWERWRAEPTPTNANPLLAAIGTRETARETLREVFAATRLDPAAPEALVEFLLYKTTYRAVWGDDLAGGLAELRQLGRDYPDFEALAVAGEAHLMLFFDRSPIQLLGHLSGGAGDIVAAEAMLAGGAVTDAMALLEAHSSDTSPIGSFLALKGLAQLLGGDVSGGVDWTLARLREAVEKPDVAVIPGLAYVAALGLAMQCRFSELDSIAELVFTLIDGGSPEVHYKVGFLLMTSITASWEGNRAYAYGLATQAKTLGAKDGPFPGMMSSVDLLHLASATAGQLWDIVDDLLAKGYLAAAVFYAVAAVEVDPHTNRADQLVQVALESQSPVLRAFADYLRAVVAKDLEQLPELVSALRNTCGPLDGIRARITYALLLRETGGDWLAQAEIAWAEDSVLQQHCHGLFDRLVKAVGLTLREQEITELVAQGKSAAEIAERMSLEKRTIETYLVGIYRKTGVNTKEKLQQVSKMWLRF